MTTTTLPTQNVFATIVAQISNVDFAVLEKDVEALARWAPMIVRFAPEAAPLLAIIPMIEQGLLVADTIKKNWGNPTAVINAILPLIEGLAPKVQAMAPHVEAAAAGQPIPPIAVGGAGGVNFQNPGG